MRIGKYELGVALLEFPLRRMPGHDHR
jgi:hypothetical protein